nr:MAG TPA: hypothetical protein [Caudoviricetes sp.]
MHALRRCSLLRPRMCSSMARGRLAWGISMRLMAAPYTRHTPGRFLPGAAPYSSMGSQLPGWGTESPAAGWLPKALRMCL